MAAGTNAAWRVVFQGNQKEHHFGVCTPKTLCGFCFLNSGRREKHLLLVFGIPLRISHLREPTLFEKDTKRDTTRFSSREVRIRVPFLSVVYFSREPSPKKGVTKGATERPRQEETGHLFCLGSLGATENPPSVAPARSPSRSRPGRWWRIASGSGAAIDPTRGFHVDLTRKWQGFPGIYGFMDWICGFLK